MATETQLGLDLPDPHQLRFAWLDRPHHWGAVRTFRRRGRTYRIRFAEPRALDLHTPF